MIYWFNKHGTILQEIFSRHYNYAYEDYEIISINVMLVNLYRLVSLYKILCQMQYKLCEKYVWGKTWGKYIMVIKIILDWCPCVV